MNNQPPKLPLRFFRWYCNGDFAEDIEGDLFERFERSIEQKGSKTARLEFTKDVIKLFRPGIIKPLFAHERYNQFGMFKNYFKIASRGLLKQKLYSGINIGGLTVGLTCFILIFIFVQHELSYDHFYQKKKNIYHIYQRQIGNTFLGSDYFGLTPAQLAGTLMTNYSEVENAITVAERSALLSANDGNFFESGMGVDGDFFEVFDHQFISGNPAEALKKRNAIILTTSLADKIFGQREILNKSITLSSYYGDKEFVITGVIEDLPKNSSFKFSYIFNLTSNDEYVKAVESPKWNSNSYHTFLLLNPLSDPLQLQNKLTDLVAQQSGADEDYPFKDIYYVRPLTDIHLQTGINFDIGIKGNPQYIALFSIIAIVVLILACINYMNLAIARSIQRAKEVGLRKVIGAMRSQLIIQFLGESVLISFMALLLALGLSYFILPFFGEVLDRSLSLDLLSNPVLIIALSVVVLIVGIFSGSYPALFMSALKPVNTLKGKTTDKTSKMKFQSWLVVFQYATSIVLIISSIVIYLQFDFIQNKELGYDKDHIMVIRTRSSELRKNIDVIRNELTSHSSILSFTTSNNLPSDIESSTLVRLKEGGSDEDNISIYRTTADDAYVETFGLELLAGKSYTTNLQSDVEKVIINESAARAFGWEPREAVGNQFYRVGQSYVEVIGVVKDFHMFSMHLTIQPLIIAFRNDYFNYASLKLKPENLPETISLIEKTVNEYSSYPFEYQFMDAEFDRMYKSDIKLGKIFGFFTVLSIIVASLGLFGLAAFTAKQRTKEIGIRKVLGASVKAIVALIAKDFVKMVVIGFLLALPLAWYINDLWLQDYAYRIELQWWIFGVAGIIAIVLSIFTISSQSLKASMANPVDSLRNE